MYQVIVIDWEEGSKVTEADLELEEFLKLAEFLYNNYGSEDYKIVNRKELWVKDSIVCNYQPKGCVSCDLDKYGQCIY